MNNERKTIIHRFNRTNLKLVLIDNNYYMVDIYDENVMYDLSNNWKHTGKEKRYIKESTKTRVIQEAKARASFSDDIKQFVEWYNNKYNITVSAETEVKSDTSDETNTTNIIDNTTNIKDALEPIRNELKEITKNIAANQKMNIFEQTLLEGIINKGKEIATEDLENIVIKHAQDFIDKTYGKLPQTIEIKNETKTTHVDGIFHKNFENIIKIVSQKIPLMLIGPAGSGKNYTLEQVAKALDLPFYFSNSITQEYKLSGFIDANGTYHETEFYKAFTSGGLFFFDEIDASCAESLIIINAAIANGYFDFPNGRITAHKDFRVVAAANTFGNGADMIYVGRNQLDGATLDRFTVMEFGYDENIEKSICKDTDLYDFIVDMRHAIENRKMRFVISMRAMINSMKMLETGLDKKTIIKSAITKSMTKDDINIILNEMTINNEWTKELRSL